MKFIPLMANHSEMAMREIRTSGDPRRPQKMTSLQADGCRNDPLESQPGQLSPGEYRRERGKAGRFVFLSEGKEMDEKVGDLPHEEEKGENRQLRVQEAPSTGNPADRRRDGADQGAGDRGKGAAAS